MKNKNLMRSAQDIANNTSDTINGLINEIEELEKILEDKETIIDRLENEKLDLLQEMMERSNYN